MSEIEEQQVTEPEYTAPSVSQEQIDALIARVEVAGSVIEGTTTTVVHAFLDRKFYLGCEFSACVSPENFNAEYGFQLAKAKLDTLIENKLWELEGYRLYRNLENNA